MTNPLIDPVQIVSSIEEGVAPTAEQVDAARNLIDEVNSLRIEAYEALRREEDERDLEDVRTEYRVCGVRADGSVLETDPVMGETYALILLGQLLDYAGSAWMVEPHIETRRVKASPWTVA